MEFISLIGAALLAVAVFVFVTAPLWRRSISVVGQSYELETDAKVGELAHERDVTLKTLRDLDFDYGLGKLSEEDYQALRARYAAQGVAILQQMDAAVGLGDVDLEAEIEAEVGRRRSIGNPPTRKTEEVQLPEMSPVVTDGTDDGLTDDDIENEIRQRRAARVASAASTAVPERRANPQQPAVGAQPIGARAAAGATNKCPACGEPFEPGDKFCAGCGATLERTCPGCGAEAAADARFCARCGAKLGK